MLLGIDLIKNNCCIYTILTPIKIVIVNLSHNTIRVNVHQIFI